MSFPPPRTNPNFSLSSSRALQLTPEMRKLFYQLYWASGAELPCCCQKEYFSYLLISLLCKSGVDNKETNPKINANLNLGS